MGLYLLRRLVRGLALATLLVVAASGFAHAGCYGSQQQLSANAVAHFTANPTQLLSEYPNGGAQMISLVRDLVASDPATLPLVLDLSAISNAGQVNSMGTGLGQAALICSRSDQTFANEIQQMVAASNNQALALAFTEVLGDQQLAAAGPGAGGGGGGGGPTGAAAGFGGIIGGEGTLSLHTAVNTTPTNFLTLNFNMAGSQSASSQTTTNTPTSSSSVSPSQ
jgi:hypothetical protein